MTSKQFCLTRRPDLYVKCITENWPTMYAGKRKIPRFKKSKYHTYKIYTSKHEETVGIASTEVRAWQILAGVIKYSEAINQNRKIIRILQASQDGVWYSTHIGQAYYVVRPKNEEDQELYYQIENSPTLLIRKSDCKVVTNRHE